MILSAAQIDAHNSAFQRTQQDAFDALAAQLAQRGIDAHAIVHKIQDFQVAIPSWALGAGGTRFGRFS